MKDLKTFIILWSTQSLSALGSSMTSFALIMWSYEQRGSALTTALLAICSYAPYIALSIFAGALSDKWNKKITMLVCDSFAALCTIAILILLHKNQLAIWHLYVINSINGFMNTVQQPASDVATSLLVKEKYYQTVSGMKSFSSSLTSILTPVIATAILALTSLDVIIAIDLATFALAFVTLAFFIKIPETNLLHKNRENTILQSVKTGIIYLKKNPGITDLILFLAAINFTASIYNAALPAMLLSRNGGSKTALGAVNTCIGLANVTGSLLASFGKKPKSRVRIICNTLFFSMATENFILAFGRTVPLWCLGGILGWIFIPIMSTNLDVLLRSNIPIEIQGRVYSVRNTLQFFTIPIGYFLGGFLVDYIFEPFMALQKSDSIFFIMFGSGKGSGAAFLFLILGIIGVLTCLMFRRRKEMWLLEK